MHPHGIYDSLGPFKTNFLYRFAFINMFSLKLIFRYAKKFFSTLHDITSNRSNQFFNP